MEEEMTGDELRALIAKLEATHGSDVDFYVRRIWAMRDRSILCRISDNEIRYPKQPRTDKKENLKKNAEARRVAMYEMLQSGVNRKDIAAKFGISVSRTSQLILGHERILQRKQTMENE
jgi:DNA-binding NarL/FixJ family response regulator